MAEVKSGLAMIGPLSQLVAAWGMLAECRQLVPRARRVVPLAARSIAASSCYINGAVWLPAVETDRGRLKKCSSRD